MKQNQSANVQMTSVSPSVTIDFAVENKMHFFENRVIYCDRDTARREKASHDNNIL